MEELQRNFKGIWIPKEIWECKELSLREKVMLVEIDSLDDEILGCFASNSYFGKFFNLSNSAISEVISSLSFKQYLDIKYERKGKQIIKRIIKINRPPYPKEVFGKLNRGIRKRRRPYSENTMRGIRKRR